MANKKNSSSRVEWNRVTWYSRIWALLVFLLIVPVVAFYVGTQYERTIDVLSSFSQ